jgi:hypothetical protein
MTLNVPSWMAGNVTISLASQTNPPRAQTLRLQVDLTRRRESVGRLSGSCGDGRGSTADLKLYGVSECLDAVLNHLEFIGSRQAWGRKISVE